MKSITYRNTFKKDIFKTYSNDDNFNDKYRNQILRLFGGSTKQEYKDYLSHINKENITLLKKNQRPPSLEQPAEPVIFPFSKTKFSVEKSKFTYIKEKQHPVRAPSLNEASGRLVNMKPPLSYLELPPLNPASNSENKHVN